MPCPPPHFSIMHGITRVPSSTYHKLRDLPAPYISLQYNHFSGPILLSTVCKPESWSVFRPISGMGHVNPSLALHTSWEFDTRKGGGYVKENVGLVGHLWRIIIWCVKWCCTNNWWWVEVCWSACVSFLISSLTNGWSFSLNLNVFAALPRSSHSLEPIPSQHFNALRLELVTSSTGLHLSTASAWYGMTVVRLLELFTSWVLPRLLTG